MSVPALRFKDDAGRDFPEWVEKSFKDVSKINQGLQIPISDRFPVGGENRHFYITNEFLRKDAKNQYFIENPPSSVLCSESDVLMTRTGNTGKVVTNVKGAFHNNFFKIGYDKKILNKDFLCEFLCLEHTQSLILKLAGTSTIPDLNHSDFYKINIRFPSLSEQTKIANFLTAVDEKITHLTQKHDLLTQYKKGVMQQIFSQELRFKDDDGGDFPEWRLHTIAEAIDNYGGTALEEFVSAEGTHNFISIGNYEKTGNYFDNGQRVVLNDKTKQKLLNKGDLVMVLNDKTQAGDLIGSTLLITEDNKFIYNQRSERLVCKIQIVDSKYIWHLFNSIKFRKEIFSVSQGGTQIYVNFPAVKKLSIPVPSLKEQAKIANFLTAIDDKITATQTQLQAVKQYKQGLLQQMFV